MKHTLYFAFVALSLASCYEPEKPSLSEDYWGEASAERNGKPWKTNPAC